MLVHRNQSGFQIIESLVALILGSLYCIALAQVCAQTMRVSTTNANRQAADLIAATVIDSMRQTSYSSLGIGTYQLLPYISQEPNLHPMPVTVDLVSWNWIGSIKSFPGTATLEIADGPIPLSKTATVTVSWSDSEVSSKTISTMAVIHQQGVWYWNPNVLPAP